MYSPSRFLRREPGNEANCSDSQNESDTESTRAGDENGSQFRPRARRIFVGLDGDSTDS